MVSVPRLAIATPGLGRDPSLAGLALLAALDGRGKRVQHFRAWGCPLGSTSIECVTGLPGRHLDDWLMPLEVCRSVFSRGAAGSDLAVVEGTLYGSPLPAVCDRETLGPISESPGRLGTLMEWLALPCLAVVDCQGWDRVHLPEIPEAADAVLLDNLERIEDLEPLSRMVRLIRSIPVVGGIGALPHVRREIEGSAPGRGSFLDRLGRLTASLNETLDVAALNQLARSREFPRQWSQKEPRSRPSTSGGFRVAYAMDEAFGTYFPDTLEALEGMGAELVEFSPLRDEAIPRGADLVMIGCGSPDDHVGQLAANCSMTASLRSHVCQGHRLYAESGGAAYLGRMMRIGGQRVPGVGIFPFEAELTQAPACPEPVERELIRPSWLGRCGDVIRGYRSGRWRLLPALEPDEDCPARSGRLTVEPDVFYRSNAVGSLVHLHLGALPQLGPGFVGRTRSSVSSPTA